MLPMSRLRCVLSADIPEAEVTHEGVALERTKQVRPDALGSLQSCAAYLAFGEAGRR